MVYDLTDEYLAEARQRAYRYQGQWTGTAGALAADVARLLIERKIMQGTITDLKDTNSQLRAAVEDRLAGKASMPTPGQLFGGGCCDRTTRPRARATSGRARVSSSTCSTSSSSCTYARQWTTA